MLKNISTKLKLMLLPITFVIMIIIAACFYVYFGTKAEKREDIAIKLVSSYNKEKESSKIGKERILNITEYLIKEKSINKKQVILKEKE